jgi:hypothetical protein
MQIAIEFIKKAIVACLVFLLAAQSGEAIAQDPQTPAQILQTQTAPAPPSSPQISYNQTANLASPADPAQASGQSGQSSSSQPAPNQQQGTPGAVGTAAAPYGKISGVAASRPAGAAIAPAKQRRARSFLIKFGLIAGACVAVGTVAALSRSSPSTPH